MKKSLSIDDFDSRLIEDVNVEYIIDQIRKVNEGATVLRAGANISFKTIDDAGQSTIATLNIELHQELGCMLYYAPGTQEECMSLGDKSRLAEKAVNDDGNFTWAGLYLENEIAIQAVEQFCANGKPAPGISWIDVGDLPELD